YFFFFSSRRRHTRFSRDWSSDVCSSDLTFVPTSSYNKLVSQLAVEQVVVLKGHESSGRFWTALAALAQWAAERPGLRRHGWLQRSEERRVGKECRSRRAPER